MLDFRHLIPSELVDCFDGGDFVVVVIQLVLFVSWSVHRFFDFENFF